MGDTDQKLGAWKESNGNAHLLCESSIVDGRVVRTTTELKRGKVGFKTGWQSANPYGQINFEVTSVNEHQTSEGSIGIVSGYDKYKVCGSADGGDPWQFGDVMGIINNVGGGNGAQIMAYAFRNDATKEIVMAGENLFSI